MIALALLRHAKAVKDDPRGDHARALSATGRDDAARAGSWLRGKLAGDVLVLASDARRTRETAELAFPAPRGSVDLRFEAGLYGASAADLLNHIRALPAVATAVLVGHNPGIGEAVRQLIGAGAADEVARLPSGYPTATAALITFAEPWREVAPGRGQLVGLFRRDGND